MPRLVNMTAKRAGQCANCSHGIRPGELITWQPKGAAWHRDCRAVAYARSQAHERDRDDRQCHSCESQTARMYTPGPFTVVACPSCWEAWLDAHDYHRQAENREKAERDSRRSAEPDCDIDRLYEDDCARRCGLA